MKNWILLICRVLFGAFFVFSGFVKAVDPLGSMYKFHDYFVAFGFAGLSPLALLMAIALSALEFVIGANLIFGAFVRTTAWVGALFMAFMTPLTLYIAIANPVTDCGCFGDALIIDNWTTFHKNILLSLLIIAILWLSKDKKANINIKSQALIVLYAFLFSVGISLYGYVRLPIFDFRPYKIGTNIVEGMTIPEDAPHDVYRTTFIYEKEGKQQQFSLENFPAGDSTWTFVKQQSILISKGFRPPIHDFSIDLDGEDITQDVLQDEGFTFLIISSKLDEANNCYQDKINQLYIYAQENGYGFYCLTSSFGSQIEEFRTRTQAEYPIAFSDEVTLKTIIRTNPGVLLLKSGVVYNMWHCDNLPKFDKPIEETNLNEIKTSNTTNKVIWLVVLFMVPIALITLYGRKTKY